MWYEKIIAVGSEVNTKHTTAAWAPTVITSEESVRTAQ
jgi:hypothetical protein